MAWTTAEENRVAALESLVDTMMTTIEELATKLMLSQTTLILESDIQTIQGRLDTRDSEISILQAHHT